MILADPERCSTGKSNNIINISVLFRHISIPRESQHAQPQSPGTPKWHAAVIKVSSGGCVWHFKEPTARRVLKANILTCQSRGSTGVTNNHSGVPVPGCWYCACWLAASNLLGHFSGTEPSLMWLVPPVFLLLWQVGIFAVTKRACLQTSSCFSCFCWKVAKAG